MGRKNFGGCKSERGMEVTALFYSLVGSAKLRGEELLLPHEYAARNQPTAQD